MKKANLSHHSALRGAFFLTACLVAQTATAAVAVDMTASPLGGGIFQYDFSIFNSGPANVVLVSIVNAPPGDPLIAPSLVVPSGFAGSYDPLGFVDFTEGTSLFGAGTTTGGFQFQSMGIPPAFLTTFNAVTVDGDTFAGNINLVPEPGVLLTASLGLLAVALAQKRLSRS